MTVLIAADSFKDALPALDVCQAMARGVRRSAPEAGIILFPLTDGGEGLADVLAFHLKARQVEVDVHDPLHRRITAHYTLSADGQTAFIEMAQASGLPLLKQEERNPLYTSTYGTGELIADALNRGVRNILLGIGGSATNDAGMGMAAALGYVFRDPDGVVLAPCGEALAKVASIDSKNAHPLICQATFTTLCDVNNPLYGPGGAAFVFGPQKGATPEIVEHLDAGLRHFAIFLKSTFGQDFSAIPGAGAAGGLGAGSMAFLGAMLKPGIDAIMKITGFPQALARATLVLTGEGRLDSQTLGGKLISGIARAAKRAKVPVIALCGSLKISPDELKTLGLAAAFAIGRKPQSLEEALSGTAEDLEFTATQAMALVMMDQNDRVL